MTEHESTSELQRPGRLSVPAWFYVVTGGLALGGAVGFAWGLGADPNRAWGSYLIGFLGCSSLALAGALFTAVHYVTSARWSVVIRRIPEAMSAFLLPAAVLSVGLFVGAGDLYHWIPSDARKTELALCHGPFYPTLPRVIASVVVAFAVWIGFPWWIRRNSVRQDATSDARLTSRNGVLSAVFLVLFAPTYSMVSVDLVMSLDPHWFSTMWAVYMFAILMQVGIAFIALATVVIGCTGRLLGFVNEHHVHDLGKLTLAFTAFWAYIAFSQFLLVWYADLPAETGFFVERFAAGWEGISVALPIVKFFVPFLVLLPRRAKHTPAVLGLVSSWIVGATFLELWWIVAPTTSPQGWRAPWLELAVFGGFLGAFLAAFGWALSRHELVPIGDPRLPDAVRHHEW